MTDSATAGRCRRPWAAAVRCGYREVAIRLSVTEVFVQALVWSAQMGVRSPLGRRKRGTLSEDSGRQPYPQRTTESSTHGVNAGGQELGHLAHVPCHCLFWKHQKQELWRSLGLTACAPAAGLCPKCPDGRPRTPTAPPLGPLPRAPPLLAGWAGPAAGRNWTPTSGQKALEARACAEGRLRAGSQHVLVGTRRVFW